MPRSRSRPGRSSGKSDSDKNDSMRYTGRPSWPIVSWSIKHELSKLGLPGSIVLHEITRPPAPTPSATASTPSTAAASAATSTSASTPSTVGATSATAPQVSTSADGTAPADLSDIQAQLQALQSQFQDLQTSFAPESKSGDDSDSDDSQVEMTQMADTIAQLSSSLQSLLASRSPTTSGSSGTLRTAPRSLSDTTLDAALKDAGNRYKKIKQLEQLVRTYRPEDFNAASHAQVIYQQPTPIRHMPVRRGPIIQLADDMSPPPVGSHK